MAGIKIANAAANNMQDARIRVGPGWKYLAGGTIALGCGLVRTRYRAVGGALASVGALGGATIGLVAAMPSLRNWFRNTWALPGMPAVMEVTEATE